jgi:hypothetical protein
MIGELKDALERRPDLFGPALLNPAGAVKRNAGWFASQEIQDVNSLYAHAAPIMIKMLHEGSRGYSANQRQWLESKIPKVSDTASVVKGKIEFMEQFVKADREGTAKMYLVKQLLSSGKMGQKDAETMLRSGVVPGATATVPSHGTKTGGNEVKVNGKTFSYTVEQ